MIGICNLSFPASLKSKPGKMRYSNLLKALTICCFVFFIDSFLLYRTGKLDDMLPGNNPSLQTSPNGGSLNVIPTKADTTKPLKKDSTERLRFPSSKSMVIIDKKKTTKSDSTKKNKERTLRELEVMSSSKSAMIFRPAIKPSDTLKIDSLKNRKVKIDQ